MEVKSQEGPKLKTLHFNEDFSMLPTQTHPTLDYRKIGKHKIKLVRSLTYVNKVCEWHASQVALTEKLNDKLLKGLVQRFLKYWHTSGRHAKNNSM